MGCVPSNIDPAQKKISRAIDQSINIDRGNREKLVSILLLGAGESGKSTIAKQMKIIHMDGFSDHDRNTFIGVVIENIFSSIQTLLSAARDMQLEVAPELQDAADNLLNMDDLSNFEEHITEFGPMIMDLWKDPAIVEAFNLRSQFQVLDCCEYFLGNLDRMVKPDYVPTDKDILRARLKTTGAYETNFVVDDISFKLVDVGGQRSERKKWMHLFQDVTAVIFCVALSEYDLKLFEQQNVNRMRESLKLFDEVCNSEWFDGVSTILFLNKSDIFAEKIKTVPLTTCFEDYNGEREFKEAVLFIQSKFTELNNHPSEKHIFPHVTTAIDTDNITHVFKSLHNIFISNALRRIDHL